MRLTICPKVYQELAKSIPGLLMDSFFGEGAIIAHLFFKWDKSLDGTGKVFGHFDVLSPKRGVFSIDLCPDAPQHYLQNGSCFTAFLSPYIHLMYILYTCTYYIVLHNGEQVCRFIYLHICSYRHILFGFSPETWCWFAVQGMRPTFPL